MPFAPAHSYILDELARREAQAQLMQQQSRQGICDAVGALRGLSEEMERQKAHAATLAQQGVENKRADEAAKLQGLRFGEEKAQAAASSKRADAELRLHQDEAGRAQARADTEAQDRAREMNKERVGGVVKEFVGTNGPKADVQDLMRSLTERSEFADVRPEDVENAHRTLLVEMADKQHAQERQAAQDAAAAGRDAEMVREHKAQTALGYAQIAAGKEKAASAAGKLSPADEKRRSTVQEIEERRSNIKRNIEALKAQVEQYGTVELTGPQSEIMEGKLNAIATDMAKLSDPDSVARPSEVETARKSLLPGGWRALIMAGDTAKQVLDAAAQEADARAEEGYRVRGVEKQPSGQVGAPAAPPGATRSADLVMVTNGIETVPVLRADLGDAKADGYTEVS